MSEWDVKALETNFEGSEKTAIQIWACRTHLNGIQFGKSLRMTICPTTKWNPALSEDPMMAALTVFTSSSTAV